MPGTETDRGDRGAGVELKVSGGPDEEAQRRQRGDCQLLVPSNAKLCLVANAGRRDRDDVERHDTAISMQVARLSTYILNKVCDYQRPREEEDEDEDDDNDNDDEGDKEEGQRIANKRVGLYRSVLHSRC